MFGRAQQRYAEGEGDVVVPLVRPPLWRPALTWTLTMTMALVAMSVADWLPHWLRGEPVERESLVWTGIVGTWLLALGLDLGRRQWLRRRPMPSILFRQRGMGVPMHGEALKLHWLAYKDVVALGESGRIGLERRAGERPRGRLWRRFFLETHRTVVAIDERWFADAAGPERFFQQLRERLANEPGVGEQLISTEALRQPAMAAMRRYPAACQAAIGLMAVLFLNTWLKGSLDTPFGLLRWGAMAPALAYRAGEAYRFVSANFLHGSWLHVAMNVWALSYLGGLMERLLGPARFVLLFVASGLLAMVASALSASALLSVGASGAIFGLLGAFAVVSVRLRRALPLGLRQPPRWWFSLVAINVALPLVWPVVDLAAHVAGFVAGAALAAALLGRKSTFPAAPGRAVTALAALCIALTLGGLGMAVARAAAANAEQERRLAELLLHDRHTTAGALGAFAWHWAVDRETDDEHLEAGTRCAREAIARDAGNADFRSTLALLLERRGQPDLARRAWLDAVEVLLRQPLSPAEPEEARRSLAAACAARAAKAWDATAAAVRPPMGTIEGHGEGWQMRVSADASQPAAALGYLAAYRADDTLAAVVRLLPAGGFAAEEAALPRSLAEALHATGAVRLSWIGLTPGLPPGKPAASERVDGRLGWTLWLPP